MKKYKYKSHFVNLDSPKEVLKIFKERFTYDPITGIIHNNLTEKNYTNLNSKGYLASIKIRFNNEEYSFKPHRLIWFLMTEEVLSSSFQIDHKNHIRSDNRWENLRKVNNQQNQFNTLPRGKDKMKGVISFIDPRNGYLRFRASISVDGKQRKIGTFDNIEEAGKYYDSAARFYRGEHAFVNFIEEFISPMGLEQLREHKKKNFNFKKAS